MLRVRPSALPLAMRCPGSLVPAQVRIEGRNTEANLGSACHAAIAEIIRGNAPDYGQIASYWDTPRGEIVRLTELAAQIWSESIAELFPDCRVEQKMQQVFGDMELVGTADVVCSYPRRVLDWKFGRRADDYTPQIQAYAALALATWPPGENDFPVYAESMSRSTRVEAYICWVRDGELETYSWAADEIDGFVARIARVAGDDERYVPGDHCAICSKKHECVARRQLVRQSVRSIADVDISQMAATDIVEFRRRLTLLDDAVKQGRAALRLFVQENGPQLSDDGYALRLVDKKIRTIVTDKAWTTLCRLFDDKEMAGFVTVGLTKMQEAIRRRVRLEHHGREMPSGAMAAKIADVWSELRQAEAVEFETRTELKEVRNLKGYHIT